MASSPVSYWCYSCSRFVRVSPSTIVCPECDGGFLEQFTQPPPRGGGCVNCSRKPPSHSGQTMVDGDTLTKRLQL